MKRKPAAPADPLGHRIKSNYEAPFRYRLPQRTYLLVRIDGRSFHTYTRNCAKPYDRNLAAALDEGALEVCRAVTGCQFAYGQSDEYSFLATDFQTHESESWFNGNVQKIASVAASLFTSAFGRARWRQLSAENADAQAIESALAASFDARVFVIPSRSEVENYFVWRQQDASRNSVNMLASVHYPHEELQNANLAQRHELLHRAGVNWNDCPADQKRGRVVRRVGSDREVTYVHKRTGETVTQTVRDQQWEVDRDIPVFTRDRVFLGGLIPGQE